MNPWRPFPLLRLILPFLAGILAGNLFPADPGRTAPVWALPAILLLLHQVVARWLTSYRFRWVGGALLILCLAASGFLITSGHRPGRDPDWFGHRPDGLFLVSLAEPPTSRTGAVKCLLEVRYRREQGQWVAVTGRAMGYLQTRAGTSPLQYGDHLLLRAGFTPVSDNSNPHSFNYAKYLSRKGILHRVTARPWEWRLTRLEPSGIVARFAFQVRDRLLEILRANRVEGREFAVAAALLLGYTEEIDTALRNDYSATGAMHILSVSGMHVGIIYLFLEWMLGFLNRSRPGRMVKAMLLLALIWFYAFITGLSPCVLRAAAMLSLPVIGRVMGRTTDMFNVMSASALFILAFNPLLVTDVGFLLSYSAVTGIVVMYRPIYDLYITSKWLPDKVWSIAAVSLAAQLATLPITLYVFHQFPNYFLLANLIVVPLSGLVIYAGIVALVLGSVPLAGMVLAKLLTLLVWLLNAVIQVIGGLPGSVTRGIFLSFPEMLLLYLALISGLLFLTYRRAGWMYLFLSFLILLNGSFLAFRLDRLATSRFVVFQAGREALYLAACQNRAVIIHGAGADTALNYREIHGGIVTNALDGWGIGECREVWLQGRGSGRVAEQSSGQVIEWAGSRMVRWSGGWFGVFSGQRVAVLTGAIPKQMRGFLPVDILILSGNPRVELARANAVFRPGWVVSDGTNSRSRTLRWQREAALAGVKFHAVTVHGAYQKEIKKKFADWEK